MSDSGQSPQHRSARTISPTISPSESARECSPPLSPQDSPLISPKNQPENQPACNAPDQARRQDVDPALPARRQPTGLELLDQKDGLAVLLHAPRQPGQPRRGLGFAVGRSVLSVAVLHRTPPLRRAAEHVRNVRVHQLLTAGRGADASLVQRVDRPVRPDRRGSSG